MCRVLNILSALLSRFLFAVHGVLMVWHVVGETRNVYYWLLVMGVALLGVEMAITIKYTHNAEWRWFSPMVFLYLSTVIPSVWFLELNLLQYNLSTNSSTHSDPQCLSQTPMGLEDRENSVEALEQTMLIILVVGRWLMPKGDMSRDQLSQLLLAYVGLGADILDIFDIFREKQGKTNRAVIIVGLSLFSWAMMQFPLVLTQTSHPKIPEQDPSEAAQCGAPGQTVSCCSSEVWSLLLTVGLQDGPFMIYRLYLMICENVLNQLMIFFTCKNILTVLLEVYRIFVVYFEQHNSKKRPHSSHLSHRQSELTNGETIADNCPE